MPFWIKWLFASIFGHEFKKSHMWTYNMYRPNMFVQHLLTRNYTNDVGLIKQMRPYTIFLYGWFDI